jgi:Ni/Fe-hydrogenase 1 B-type cytochrome subunit
MASTITSPGVETSPFIQQHSAPLRIWHWLTFLFLTSSMVTVLLVSTLFSQRDNIKLVQDQLKGQGVTVTNDQAFSVTREYEDKLWNVHKYLGFGLVFLLLSRVAIEFIQPEDEKLMNKLKKVKELRAKNDANQADYNHYMWVRISYTIFFVLLFCMGVTGLGLAFGRNLNLSREIHGSIKEVHSIIQYLMYAFVAIHLTGVIIAENGKIKGIVSGMIHGNHS